MFTRFGKLSKALCLVALCIIAPAAAMAADNASQAAVSGQSDSQLAAGVAHAIRMYSRYDIFDWVEGNVVNGVVTLTGAVREPFRKDDYGRIVAAVAGVSEVKNELKVLPLSTFDDQIRRSASRAIYRDPMFTAYLFQATPPIHIVVENGRVTLKGIVANAMERQVAETKVRTNVTSFEVVNDLKIEDRG